MFIADIITAGLDEFLVVGDVACPCQYFEVGIDEFGCGDEMVSVFGMGDGDDEVCGICEGLGNDFDVEGIAIDGLAFLPGQGLDGIEVKVDDDGVDVSFLEEAVDGLADDGIPKDHDDGLRGLRKDFVGLEVYFLYTTLFTVVE